VKYKKLHRAYVILAFTLNMLWYGYYLYYPADTLSLYIIASVSIIHALYLIKYTITKTKNIFSLFSIFMIFSFMFYYGKLFSIYYSSPDDVLWNMIIIEWEVDINNLLLSIILSNTMFIIISMFITPGVPTRDLNKDPYHDSRAMFVLYCFISILALSKYYLEAKYIFSTNYLNLYTNGLANVNYYSPIIKYSHTLFTVLFGFILSLRPSKKKFIVISIIYILVNMLSAFKGARILVLLPVLFVFWYYYKYFMEYGSWNTKRNFKYMIILLLIISGSVTPLKYIRMSESKLNILEYYSPLNILSEIGNTLWVTAIYLQEREYIVADYPYVIEPIIYPYYILKYPIIMRSGQSEELISLRNSMNHRITQYMSNNAYLSGRGIGSSMIGEAYQYGLGYFFLINILFGFYLKKIDEYASKNTTLFLFLSPIIIPSLFMAARTSPFPNTWGILKSILLYYFFRIIWVAFATSKNRLQS